MANGGDAETLEVVLCQIGQQFASDVILAECRLVSFKAERSKPVRDVHRRSSPQSGRWQGVCSVSLDLSSGNLRIGAQVAPRSDPEAFHRDGTSASLGWSHRSAH